MLRGGMLDHESQRHQFAAGWFIRNAGAKMVPIRITLPVLIQPQGVLKYFKMAFGEFHFGHSCILRSSGHSAGSDPWEDFSGT